MVNSILGEKVSGSAKVNVQRLLKITEGWGGGCGQDVEWGVE